MFDPASYSRHKELCVLDMRNKQEYTSGVRKKLGHTLQRGNAFYSKMCARERDRSFLALQAISKWVDRSIFEL